jgi:hypothetical protein
LYTQFKEKSFIAGLGTTAATHFHVKRCFAIQAVEATELFPMAAKTLEQGFEVRPFLKVKPRLQYKI